MRSSFFGLGSKPDQTGIAVAGHVQRIKFSDKVVLKETGVSELQFYQQVFAPNAASNLVGFRQFIPMFYGGDEQVGSKESVTKQSSGCILKIENIMKDLRDDYLSVIDLKIGTSSITMRCRQGH